MYKVGTKPEVAVNTQVEAMAASQDSWIKRRKKKNKPTSEKQQE